MNAVINPVRSMLLTGIMLTVFGAQSVFAQGTLTPEQLSLRVERLTELSQRSEAKLSAVQAQMKTMSDDMSRLGRLVDNRAMLDMIQQVDEISEEIGLLRGEIEVQGKDINDIKKRQRELYLDIDRRLRDMESGATAAAPAGQITVPQVDSTTSSTGQQTPSVEPTTNQPDSTSTQTTTPEPTPSTTQSEEKAAYQTAFDALKEGRYKKAKTDLRAFLKKFPNSSYAGNAQYWLGEANYVTRNFEQGIVEFEKVINNYPTSNKLPDAMLKLGYTFYELKQFPQAKAILQDLRERFPNATASRLATKRLDRMRKEGH
jgi:tol-pal system protein YbgF